MLEEIKERRAKGYYWDDKRHVYDAIVDVDYLISRAEELEEKYEEAAGLSHQYRNEVERLREANKNLMLYGEAAAAGVSSLAGQLDEERKS